MPPGRREPRLRRATRSLALGAQQRADGRRDAGTRQTRSLVEEEDQHMKLSLGSSEMGLSSHLQSSKAGTTRIFTSNTHSSVVLQVE